VVDADERWTLHELNQAVQRFEEIFDHAVKKHGSEGRQAKITAYLWKARWGWSMPLTHEAKIHFKLW